MVYWICFYLARLINRIYFRCTYVGKEHLPQERGYIIASNHISNLDPFIIGINSRRRYNYIAKEELFQKRFWAWFYDQVGTIPIKRGASDFHAIRETVRRLKKGEPVIVFPEGTRGVGGLKKKPQPGIGLIASKANVPVIPAFIEGSDQALPNGAKWFKRHHVRITFGEPVPLDQNLTYEQISSRILERVYALSPSNPAAE